MSSRLPLIAVAAALLATGPAQAQQVADLFVSPSKGQDQDQQDLDTVQCQRWAKEQTGFDPSQPPPAPPPSEQSSSVAGGALLGALGGAALGAIIDGKDGAGKGALAGGLLGGMRSSSKNRQSAQQQQQWEQQQMAQYNNNRSKWNRAFSACMEGRGYTVR
jgi:uncharacterized membrane protein YebE (DUF533 family)